MYIMSFDFDSNSSNIIEIWIEERGRKSDTYISGWNIEEDTLKSHLKIIKKKRGCNGSIKKINSDNIMQLQGNVKDFIISYLKEIGINEDNIKIKI